MIDLEKFPVIMAPLYSDPNDPRLDLWLKHWKSKPGFSFLDTIRTTEEELGQLMLPLSEMKDRSLDLLEKAALPEFEFEIYSEEQKAHIRFKKTILPKTPVELPLKDGVYMVITPAIDAFCSFFESTIVDSVSTIFGYTIYEADGNEVTTGTMNKEFWRSLAFQIDELDTTEISLTEIYRNIRLSYIAVQKAMYDKPLVFSEAGIKRRSVKNGKKKHRNTVKVVKTICLNPDALLHYSEPHYHMTCPCWGVVGHWRKYKSGKKVWIEPYRKGRERNNPSAYHPKNYALEVSL